MSFYLIAVTRTPVIEKKELRKSDGKKKVIVL